MAALERAILRRRLRAHGFGSLHDVAGRRAIPDCLPGRARCGLYYLEFADGECYVGQAIDVQRRFTEHTSRWKDIVAFAFSRQRRRDLDRTEIDTIEDLEQRGALLRNVRISSAPQQRDELDFVVSARAQARWLASGHGYRTVRGRVPLTELRRRSRTRYAQLRAHQHGETAIRLFQKWVRLALPSPGLTEVSFWSASAKPTSSRLVTVSVNWQENLTIGTTTRGVYFSLHLARSPLVTAFGRTLRDLDREFGRGRVPDHRYMPGGGDQTSLWLPSEEEFAAALARRPVVEAIRLLNLRLMRKGPCAYPRSHCPWLLDAL